MSTLEENIESIISLLRNRDLHARVMGGMLGTPKFRYPGNTRPRCANDYIRYVESLELFFMTICVKEVVRRSHFDIRSDTLLITIPGSTNWLSIWQSGGYDRTQSDGATEGNVGDGILYMQEASSPLVLVPLKTALPHPSLMMLDDSNNNEIRTRYRHC